ncbi:MAG: hypothetical protein ABIP51_06425 [Bacteroidia bacterium]
MKKTILTILIGISTTTIFSQIKPNDNAKFYGTYQDYKDHKPMAGIAVNQVEKESIEINNNVKIERIKASKLPSAFFTNINGMLMRVFDNAIYYVIVDGPLCYYINPEESQVGYSGLEQLSVTKSSPDDYAAADYYSETISGDIKKLKDEVFEEFLEKHNLKTQYNSDRVTREAKDTVDGYKSKLKTKTAKYFKLINEKIQ